MRWFPLCVVAGLAVLAASAPADAAPAPALAAPAPAHAAAPSAEHISSYAVTLDLGADGLLRVHEEIAYDFGDASGKHGIDRVIPTNRIEIEHVRATSTDGPAPSQVTRKGNELDVRIGDPSRTVTGQRHYTIDYDVRHAVASDKLSWNAIGGEWTVPIDVATVRLKGPAAFTSLECLAGPALGMQPCKGAWNTGGGNAAFGQNLGAGQGMLIRAKFPSGTVRNQRPGPFPVHLGVPGLSAFAFVLLAVLAAVGTRWLDRRRRRRLPATLPREVVPPAEVASVPNGHTPPDVLAVVALDLAVRGYLRIADNGKRVTLTCGDQDPSDLSGYEAAFLKQLLNGRDRAEPGQDERERLKRIEHAIRRSVGQRRDPYLRKRTARLGTWFLAAGWGVSVAGAVVLLHGLGRDGGFGDEAAIGTSLIVLAFAAGLLRPENNPYTRRGQDMSVRYQHYVDALPAERDKTEAEEHLPYAAAMADFAWMQHFIRAHRARGSLPSWYSYTGKKDDAEAERRFYSLAFMFAGPDGLKRVPKRVAPVRRRKGRRPRRTRSSIGGFGGYGHTGGDAGGFAGGGFGGGGGHGGGGGDGGGGGGSW
ncbi:DUF2207 domain-containing protein [Actinomadura rupiterrae]|uniref:DUF2207 domain-containing protein n=1 Tax=Actinomadura rupiterrae TaxID=559627 RepID=UPI0020A5FCD9|nr:DUF2207 domain-containing protein [Actinomadura rupiterrae]MCP2334723.1 hypothetical protein [Actinomadura rupiterrae]